MLFSSSKWSLAEQHPHTKSNLMYNIGKGNCGIGGIIIKKFIVFALAIVMTLFLFGGFISKKEANNISNGKETDVRKIAWNDIPKAEMPHIVGSWKDAKVYKRPLKEFNMKQVYIVSFPTNENPTLGDYVIYIDINTKRFLGIGIRD